MSLTDTSAAIPPEIQGYLESIISDAGMSQTDPEYQQSLVYELFARLDQYITAVIIDRLPSDALEPFIKLHEENRPQSEIEQYIKDHMPDASTVLSQAFIDFREEYLGSVSLAKGRPDTSHANVS